MQNLSVQYVGFPSCIQITLLGSRKMLNLIQTTSLSASATRMVLLKSETRSKYGFLNHDTNWCLKKGAGGFRSLCYMSAFIVKET